MRVAQGVIRQEQTQAVCSDEPCRIPWDTNVRFVDAATPLVRVRRSATRCCARLFHVHFACVIIMHRPCLKHFMQASQLVQFCPIEHACRADKIAHRQTLALLPLATCRFFGGIKLGSGGLVRAYGGAARDCLRAAPKQFVKRQVEVRVEAPFQSLGAVYGVMQRYSASPSSEEQYTESGGVAVRFMVDVDVSAAVIESVSNATSGKVLPELVDAEG